MVLQRIKEKFSEATEVELTHMEMMTIVLLYLCLVVVAVLCGQQLWNICLVPSVNIVKPIQSTWQFFGIMILSSILSG
jgi:hypothetical protein